MAPAHAPNALPVLIAGGGASGLLLAHALLRSGASVTIVEPRDKLGAGLAYSTTCPLHLLNAPAGKMSAIADEPDHFLAWLAERGIAAEPTAFIARTIYGDYLRAIASDLHVTARERFTHVQSRAIDARADADGVSVTCADGTHVRGSALVVAVGNAKPSRWAGLTDDVLASPRFFRSAWNESATVSADPSESVVLLGTGLTAVDAVLALRENGHRGEITMLSRRGLLPHEHRIFDRPPATAPEATSVRDVISIVRRRSGTSGHDWRMTVDALRSETNARWNALSLPEQRRLVRHLLPYWNVHRHRMAPEVAKHITELLASGSLRMIAGRSGTLAVTAGAIEVPVTLRGSRDRITLSAGRVINCSGPEHDVRKRKNPLIRQLITRGDMVPHPLGIGARIARDGAFLNAAGTPSDRFFALGPVRFGTLIETTAIPEIRAQAADLASVLAALTGPAAATSSPATRDS